MIPQADPGRRFAEKRSDILAAIQRVFNRGAFILGEEVERFESEFADYLGVAYVVGVGSGTDALTLALKALGIERGDEVITVSLTAAATALGIEEVGATPVFVEVDRVTRCMDTEALEAAIGPRTAAIIPVHLHGFPAAMEKIMGIASRHGVYVVEDCAQAHGAAIGARRVGSFGHAAAFSFYPTKNLGAPGDAGAVATNSCDLAAKIKTMRFYGFDESRLCVGPGSNRRLDELQAAILRVLLPHLDRQNAERRLLAAEYRSSLINCHIGLPPESTGAVYHQFAITVDHRDDVRRLLAARGIGTNVHYALGVHRHPHFAKAKVSLPITDELTQQLLSVPIQPEIARGQVEDICRLLSESVTIGPP
jgi:dTDP-4-amino-4,6-dideoxygalactose transaminase